MKRQETCGKPNCDMCAITRPPNRLTMTQAVILCTALGALGYGLVFGLVLLLT